jgi:hypothetical protein
VEQIHEIQRFLSVGRRLDERKGQMPRYYFHLHNDVEVWDEEGGGLSDLKAATDEALQAAR